MPKTELKPTTKDERERWKRYLEPFRHYVGGNSLMRTETILRLIDDVERLEAALEPFASAGRVLPKDKSNITDVETPIKVPTKVKYYLAAREALDAE